MMRAILALSLVAGAAAMADLVRYARNAAVDGGSAPAAYTNGASHAATNQAASSNVQGVAERKPTKRREAAA